MTTYELVIDFGRPYSVYCINDQHLLNEIEELGQTLKGLDFDVPYCDVWIYDGQDNDITEQYKGILDKHLTKHR